MCHEKKKFSRIFEITFFKGIALTLSYIYAQNRQLKCNSVIDIYEDQ